MRIEYKNFLKDNFLLLVLFFAVIIVLFRSYDRFIVRHDYIVGYEGVCDTTIEKCFVGVDDTNGEEYYYTKMQKYEPDLYTQCGKDITDCDAANVCFSNDRDCLIVYCDEKTKNEDEECASDIEKLDVQNNNNDISSIVDKTLQNNITDDNL